MTVLMPNAFLLVEKLLAKTKCYTNAHEFRDSCRAAKIKCDTTAPDKYFNPGLCDGAFLTTEYTYDAQILKKWFLERLSNVCIVYGHRLERMEQSGGVWRVTAGELTVETPYVLNATYAGISDIHSLLGLEPIKSNTSCAKPSSAQRATT